MRAGKHAGCAVEEDGQMDKALLSQTKEVSTNTSHTRVAEFRDNQTRHSGVCLYPDWTPEKSSGLGC